jgi:hypothetical protein
VLAGLALQLGRRGAGPQRWRRRGALRLRQRRQPPRSPRGRRRARSAALQALLQAGGAGGGGGGGGRRRGRGRGRRRHRGCAVAAAPAARAAPGAEGAGRRAGEQGPAAAPLSRGPGNRSKSLRLLLRLLPLAVFLQTHTRWRSTQGGRQAMWGQLPRSCGEACSAAGDSGASAHHTPSHKG